MTAFYCVYTRQKEPGSSLVVRVLSFPCQGSGFSPQLGNWDSASLSQCSHKGKRENVRLLSVPILRGPPLWLYLTVCCLVTKLCPTFCNPMDCSPPGSSVHGISQARFLEWVAFPPPGNLPNPGIEPESPALAGEFFTAEPPRKPCCCC